MNKIYGKRHICAGRIEMLLAKHTWAGHMKCIVKDMSSKSR